MSKDPHFIGQPALAQLLKGLPSNDEMEKIALETKTDYYYKTLTGTKHLVILLFAVLGHCHSLRELETAQNAHLNKLQHLGLDRVIPRSTLSDANTNRPFIFFKEVFEHLRARYLRFYSDSCKKVNSRFIYALDSTTISLFVDVFEGACRGRMDGKKKGGVKVHTLYNVNAGIPEVVSITDATVADVKQAECLLKLEPGSIVLFDRGYFDFDLFRELSKAGIHFVTRAKKNTIFKALAELEGGQREEEDPNVLFDQSGVLRHGVEARRVVYYNDVKMSYDVNLTNITDLEGFDSKAIHELYRLRWKIEELFKLLKQNYDLTTFLGNSRNAIMIQIYVILIAFILTMMLKLRVQNNRTWAYSVMVANIRLMIMSYIDLEGFFSDPEKAKRMKKKKTAHTRGPTLKTLFKDL